MIFIIKVFYYFPKYTITRQSKSLMPRKNQREKKETANEKVYID